MQVTLKSLYILATVVETPDWFNHSEDFYFKEEEIENTIEGFIDSVRELTIHEIIEDLKENKAEEIGDKYEMDEMTVNQLKNNIIKYLKQNRSEYKLAI